MLYHLAFPRDGLVATCLVYGVYVINTAQTVLVTRDIFNTYATQYGNISLLDAMQNEWLAIPVFSSISMSII